MEILWLPTADTDIKGTVLVAHGYGEHHGRYQHFIDALNAAGYDVATYDHYAHGMEPGPHTRVDVARLIRDHLEVRDDVAKAARTDNIYLFGHSMGGLVTAASTLLQPQGIQGTVLTGPALASYPRLPFWVVRALMPVAYLLPWLPAAPANDPDGPSTLSRVPEVQEQFFADPLTFKGPTPLLTGATILYQGHRVLQNAHHLRVPTVIYHGSADALVDSEGSREFVRSARAGGHTEDVELHVIPGAYHEVLNEYEAPEIIADIITWLGQH